MFRNFLCWLGIHNWKYILQRRSWWDESRVRECQHCHKKQRNISGEDGYTWCEIN